MVLLVGAVALAWWWFRRHEQRKWNPLAADDEAWLIQQPSGTTAATAAGHSTVGSAPSREKLRTLLARAGHCYRRSIAHGRRRYARTTETALMNARFYLRSSQYELRDPLYDIGASSMPHAVAATLPLLTQLCALRLPRQQVPLPRAQRASRLSLRHGTPGFM